MNLEVFAQVRVGERLVAVGVLVQYALVVPGHPVAEKLAAPEDVAGILADQDGVAVGGQPAERRYADHGVVGVHHPDVVGLALGQRERLGAVVSEVLPGALVQLAGDS